MTSNSPDRPEASRPKAFGWALLVVLPYVLLSVVWAFTNPPDAAPDEHDHLIKALAAGGLDVGIPFEGQLYDESPAALRNISIARTVTIPIRLFPGGFDCLARHVERSAGCLPKGAPPGEGTMSATTMVGAYPVFGYVPMGSVALFAHTPSQAFVLGRLVSVLMSSVFLLLAALQLVRWLGRGAVLGLAVALTPMVLFSAASLSTSGLEIMTAIVVGSIAVIATRRPEALADRATLVTLAVSAAGLLLSRQLGVAALVLAAVVALSRGGAQVVWRQVRAGRPAMIVTIAVVALAALTVLWWERTYDNPAVTASITSSFSATSLSAFADNGLDTLREGIGWFGWVDTPLPGPAIALWVVITIIVIGGAAVIGSRADAWTLVLALLYLLLVALVVQGTVFTPVQSAIQGRHLLPMFSLLPLLAGVVMHERISELAGAQARRRLYGMVGVVAAGVQLFAILYNARRYAVGIDGPVWFLPTAQWAPRFGWVPWLLLAIVAAAGLVVLIYRSGLPDRLPLVPDGVPTLQEDGDPASPPAGAAVTTRGAEAGEARETVVEPR